MPLIALLRGINVGTAKRVDMKKLKALCEKLGYTDVSTYINSGNVVFETKKSPAAVEKELKAALKHEFGFDIDLLIKTHAQMMAIAKAIPSHWENDETQRTDVAYLFSSADTKKILSELPFKTEYVDTRYVKGALVWNIQRKNYNKTQLNKLIGHKLYKLMTMRNVNTARFLAKKQEKNSPKEKSVKSKVSAPAATTIDAYITAFPKDLQIILKKIRSLIHTTAPLAEEAMSYGMPTFKLNGKNLVHFAAWENHIGFYATPSGHEAFQKELSKYKGAKGSVQFPLSEPMPYKLIERIVKFRVKEVQAKKK